MTTQAKSPIDETLAHPGATTLDECLTRQPNTITDADLDIIIAHSREERTRFQLKAEQKEAKEEGIDEGPPEEPDDRTVE